AGQGAVRDVLFRVPRCDGQGRRAARAPHPEPTGLQLGARAGHGARPPLPRHQPGLGTHAGLRLADLGRPALADRGLRTDAAREGGAGVMNAAPRFTARPFSQGLALGMTGLGLASVAAGLAVSPERTWANVLVGDLYLLFAALSGALLLSLLFLS